MNSSCDVPVNWVMATLPSDLILSAWQKQVREDQTYVWPRAELWPASYVILAFVFLPAFVSYRFFVHSGSYGDLVPDRQLTHRNFSEAC